MEWAVSAASSLTMRVKSCRIAAASPAIVSASRTGGDCAASSLEMRSVSLFFDRTAITRATIGRTSAARIAAMTTNTRIRIRRSISGEEYQVVCAYSTMRIDANIARSLRKNKTGQMEFEIYQVTSSDLSRKLKT